MFNAKIKAVGMALVAGSAWVLASPILAQDMPETQEKIITVTHEGEGLYRTHWQSFRKAQLKLALELPSLIYATASERDLQTQVDIQEVLAQFIAAEVLDRSYKMIELGEADPDEPKRGMANDRRQDSQDSQDNPAGTRYRVINTFKFTISNAEQVKRAQELREQQALLEEIKALRSEDGFPSLAEIMRINQGMPFGLMKELSQNRGLRAVAMEDLMQGKDVKEDGLPGTVASVLDGLNAERQENVIQEANREYSFYRARHLADRLHDGGRGGYRAAVEAFVEQLPLYLVATLEPTGASMQHIRQSGSWGSDLYFQEPMASHMGASGHQAYTVEAVTVQLDNTCSLEEKKGSGITLCDAWKGLPDDFRTLMENEMPYAGSWRMSPGELEGFLEGYTPFGQLHAMPTAERRIWNNDLIPTGRSWQQFQSGHKPDSWSRNQFDGSPSVAALFGLPRPVPDLFAAGFVGREPVTLTIMFPGTGEYLDVALTGDRYLLRPESVTAVLYDPEMRERDYKLRSNSIKATVWWPGTGEDHPAEGMREIGGGQIHHASLPKHADDAAQLSHLQFLREHRNRLNSTGLKPAEKNKLSHIVGGVNQQAVCGGWMQRYIDHGDCSNHLLLAVGEMPGFSNERPNMLHWLPNTRAKEPTNNPMEPMEECETLNPRSSEPVSCEDHFADLDLILTSRGAGIPNMRTLRFWPNIARPVISNGAERGPKYPQEGYNMIYDPYMDRENSGWPERYIPW